MSANRQWIKPDVPMQDDMFMARVDIFKPSAVKQQRTVLISYEQMIEAGSQAEADSMFAAVVQEECYKAGVRLSQWMDVAGI